MRRGIRQRGALSATVAATVAAGICALAPAAAAAKAPEATIKRTAHGIPNIQADDFEGLGYGYGYAFAEDNICAMADQYVTVRAERSRFFGPEGSYQLRGNGSVNNNLDSDFFYQRAIDDQVVEDLLEKKPPIGPRKGVIDGVRGYVRGYNQYLEETGVDNISDPACRGEDWVRPIKFIDAFRRFYQLGLLASQGVAINGVGGAQPPTPALPAPKTPPRGEDERTMLEQLGERLHGGGLGSNAFGLGSQATRNGRGMVLANPHFPWDGTERFYQSHLTIPGKVNVSGASLFGVPIVLIGHTERLAWSHTVSTAFRFTPFQLQLVPGSPTTYLVDGQPREMERDQVTVEARTEDGSVEQRSRTLYSTVYGPMFDEILGLPLFPWTSTTAYAMGDANATNFRYLNHFFDTNRAQSTDELLEILREDQGIPWVNTIASDSRGKALYADIGAIPNVPDSKVQACNSPGLGTVAFEVLGLPVLDGSRSSCDWDDDPDALEPGLFGPANEPHLFRRDYVTNSNDSYWLSNPAEPLEGFARIIGDERTTRSLRTRLGLIMVQQRLAGDDDYSGKRFTRGQLQKVVFNNRQYAGELWRDPLVELCEQNPTLAGSSGPVDVSEACPVLARWDVHDDLDSSGALLFRRFASRVLGTVGGVVPPPTSAFEEPFDPNRPVETPSGLNTDDPNVRRALADAVDDLRDANIPLDAGLRGYQFERRGEQRIPIHGGPGDPIGVFNAINVPFVAGQGYPNVPHGSSFVMATSFRDGCPDDRSILTYSQSTDPSSPWFADQTRMFSEKEWVDPPFCAGEVREARAVSQTRLGASPGSDGSGGDGPQRGGRRDSRRGNDGGFSHGRPPRS